MPKEADTLAPAGRLTYKETEQVDLILKGYYPEDLKKGDNRPAIILFHGGGWVCGKPQQFYQQARVFRDQGIVAFSATYRLINKHHTTVYECIKDGKSAVRWLRAHAEKLGIDPDKIIAGGGSAGGHVAACTAMIEGYEEEGEDQTVSSKPNALILFSPVLDTTEEGYGSGKMIKGEKTDLSPCHHVRAGMQPTILFHGTRDTTVPPENAERFAELMKEAGNYCVRVPYEGRRHSFFNGSGFRKNNTDEDFNTTMEKSIEFLRSIKFLPEKSKAEGDNAESGAHPRAGVTCPGLRRPDSGRPGPCRPAASAVPRHRAVWAKAGGQPGLSSKRLPAVAEIATPKAWSLRRPWRPQRAAATKTDSTTKAIDGRFAILMGWPPSLGSSPNSPARPVLYRVSDWPRVTRL